MEKQQEACRQQEERIQSLNSELESAQKSESDARFTIQQLEEGAARALEQITDLQKQVDCLAAALGRNFIMHDAGSI